MNSKKNSLSLAQRTKDLRPEGAYAVLNKAAALEKKGRKIIHLEVGQPDFPTLKNVSQAGIEAIKKGLTKYSPPLGILPLRQAIAREVNKTRGLDISGKQIAITPSSKTAIFTAMFILLERGDEVIYPEPGFPTYQTLIDFFGAVRKPVPLLEKNNFSFDVKILQKQFSKKTKLIILNSPSNPTGGIIPKQDLEKTAKMIRGSKCWVLTDEIYSKIVYDDFIYPSFYGLKNIQNRTILVDGFSKTYSMTGWRIGYLVVPEKIIEKVDYFLTHSVGCTATFTQHAVLSGLNGSQIFVRKMVKEFEKRRNFMVKELNKIEGVICNNPQGAFYVFPNVKAFRKSSSWIADYLLEKAGVALLDGTSFGKFGEGYLRLSYANSISNLKKAIFKIKFALKKLRKY